MPKSDKLSPSFQNRRKRTVFFGWYIVAAGFWIQALAYGARYSFAVFFPSLTEQFNWPRDLTASIFSVHLLFYGLTAPVAGFFVDRVGPRVAMSTGTGLLALGLMLSYLGSQPWHFFLSYGVLTGMGLCLLGSVPVTMVIRNWFERRRGMAISLIYMGAAVAYGCYPVVTWLINTLGWRRAFFAEGLVIALVFFPLIALVMYYHPEQKGLSRDGLSRQDTDPAILEREARRIVDKDWAGVDWTLPRAVKTMRFWVTCLANFLILGLGHHLLVAHHVAAALDAGFSKSYASAVLAFNGLFFGVGTLVSVLSDRFGRESSMTLGCALMISGVLVLMQMTDATQPWMLYYYAASTGLGFGICLPTSLAVVTDLFQGPKVGSTMGTIWFCLALGGMAGPWAGGFLFEMTRNYQAAFVLAALSLALGCAALWLAAPRKVRLVPGRVKK